MIHINCNYRYGFSAINVKLRKERGGTSVEFYLPNHGTGRTKFCVPKRVNGRYHTLEEMCVLVYSFNFLVIHNGAAALNEATRNSFLGRFQNFTYENGKLPTRKRCKVRDYFIRMLMSPDWQNAVEYYSSALRQKLKSKEFRSSLATLQSTARVNVAQLTGNTNTVSEIISYPLMSSGEWYDEAVTVGPSSHTSCCVSCDDGASYSDPVAYESSTTDQSANDMDNRDDIDEQSAQIIWDPKNYPFVNAYYNSAPNNGSDIITSDGSACGVSYHGNTLRIEVPMFLSMLSYAADTSHSFPGMYGDGMDTVVTDTSVTDTSIIDTSTFGNAPVNNDPNNMNHPSEDDDEADPLLDMLISITAKDLDVLTPHITPITPLPIPDTPLLDIFGKPVETRILSSGSLNKSC